MLSILIDAAKEVESIIEGHVNQEGVKAMYHLLWDNPNASKRKQFRAKMKELVEENGIGGPQLALKHLDGMANLIGVEIVVMSHGPRGDKQDESGWQQPKNKRKNKEAQNKGKEKERENTKKEGKKTGGVEKGEGRTRGKSGGGRGDEGRTAANAEPQWEEGALDQEEWDTPLLRQEEVVPDGKGVALCSRKVFFWKTLILWSATEKWQWNCQEGRNGFKPKAQLKLQPTD